MGLDPLRTTAHIKEAYLNYLTTAFPLSDAALADQFRQRLSEEDHFVKGPFLEATPPFQTGRSLHDLIDEGVLSAGFREIQSEGLPLDRPLYVHQEQAIRKATSAQRNLVVATGTGSGKTESFLIPILNYLLRQKEQTGQLTPGVRALLLYPMNALANDQLKRLRVLLQNYADITFGRYTGETKTSQPEAEKHFRHHYATEPIPNELLSREEMRATPPHLLLTNYAMLEYLLLRPEDCNFFDGSYAGEWRFLILDEAHTYNGAVGIEMAMLLRRLKDRVKRGKKHRLQAIATSATLGGGREDFPAVTRFATQLFGERFEWRETTAECQDVVEAARIPVEDLGPRWGKPNSGLYTDWQHIVKARSAPASQIKKMVESGKRLGVPRDILQNAENESRQVLGQGAVQAFLYRVLRGDEDLHTLRERLTDKPCLLSRIAADILGDNAQESAVALVDLAVQAKAQKGDLPLLPARYHLFVRALEGGYVSLTPEPRLFLDRQETVEQADEAWRVFEAASCRRCGALYLVGKTSPSPDLRSPSASVLRHPPTISEENREDVEFYLLLEKSAPALPADDDEDIAAEEEWQEEKEIFDLCGKCGALDPKGSLHSSCCCAQDQHQHRQVQKVPSRDRQVNHCPACGTRSPGLVLRFLTGQDAATSVLATALYQEIPSTPEPLKEEQNEEQDEWTAADPRPARDSTLKEEQNEEQDEWGAPPPAPSARPSDERKKLLVFSDSRQDAAFFACYLDRTYNQLLRRRLLVLTLKQHPEAVANKWRIQDLAEPTRRTAEELGIFPNRWSLQQKIDEVWKWLLLELLPLDRRNSLEGLGILGFRLVRPQVWSPPPPLLKPPWELSPDEARELYALLLSSFRLQGAVSFPDSVEPTDEAFAPRNREYYFRDNTSVRGKHILSWRSPAHGKKNRRLDLLTKLSRTLANGVAKEAETLAGIWRNLVDKNSAFADYFRQDNKRAEGIVYRLRHDYYEIVPNIDQTHSGVPWWRCKRCGNISLHNLREICPTYGCDGKLEACEPAAAFKDNHYRQLYLGLTPVGMTVEEHTAQLTGEAAAALQDKFTRGEVNTLSCSTTFELGVDVGELEAVLLRNVPPETANYIQRAGRAGRRADATAFSLTFCQRRSHDLTYFQEPERIISGRVRPPYFELRNEKIIRRHAHAVALGMFFQQHPNFFGDVKAFFFPSDPAGPEQFQTFLEQRPRLLQEALHWIVPAELQDTLDITGWGWVGELFDEPQGRLHLATEEVRTTVASLEDVRQELNAAKKPADHILRAIDTIRERHLLEYLANRNILPKYGFPVDVVELELLHHGEAARRLELQRDLRIAIAEYAPESEVVAGGQLWKSNGLKCLPQLAWPRYRYAICQECGRYDSVHAEAESLPSRCRACRGELDRPKIFIEPKFGFQTQPKKPKAPGESRPERTYSSRVYFAGDSQEEKTFRENKNGVLIEGSYARHGKLAVVNRAGFKICSRCGFGLRASHKFSGSHQTAWGRDCTGTLTFSDLGHEFLSDILDLRIQVDTIQQEDFWLSLLYALLEGASAALSVRRQDLDGCLYPYAGRHMAPALVLFDNVPGGAGHVGRVGKHLEGVLQAARDRVDGRCGCGGGPAGPGDTSCYGCLRNYRNQFCHDQLSRGEVFRFLQNMLC